MKRRQIKRKPKPNVKMRRIRANETKAIPPDELRFLFDGIDFATPPMNHQLVCMLWGMERKRINLWLDIGTGKTLAALYISRLWGCERILVVCPNGVVETWQEQIPEHTPTLRPIILQGTAEERKSLLHANGNVFVINYEGLRTLYAHRPKSRKTGKASGAFHVKGSLFDKYPPWDVIIFDECHKLKNKDALQTRIAVALSQRTERIILMTGSPTTKDERDLWAEAFVLNLGDSLGFSFGQFLKKYFTVQGFDRVLKPGAKRKILQRLAPHTIRYDRRECFELPPKTYSTRTVKLSKEQCDLSRELIKQADSVADENTGAILQVGAKLAQVSGGSLIESLEDGERSVHRTKANPKLAELMYLLEEEVVGKVLVFHSFVEEGRMIEEACKRSGISHVSLRGEIPRKLKLKNIQRFRKGDARVLIAHPACGGEGLNLQMATTSIFYSNGHNSVHRVQSEGRIHRKGQDKPCIFVDILGVMEDGDGVDARILSSLQRKRDTAQQILDFMQVHGR